MRKEQLGISAARISRRLGGAARALATMAPGIALVGRKTALFLRESIATRWRKYRTRRTLERLTDRQLADVGLLDAAWKRRRLQPRPFWWLPYD